MLEISHMVNPVKVKKSSDLYIAQPITFETMRIARNFCANGYWDKIEVTHLTTQYPGDRAIILGDFKSTPDLERSILDIKSFNIPRKLPLIKDILDRLYYNSSTEYLIYSNVDVGLQPSFYHTIFEIIEQGYDAFPVFIMFIIMVAESDRPGNRLFDHGGCNGMPAFFNRGPGDDITGQHHKIRLFCMEYFLDQCKDRH